MFPENPLAQCSLFSVEVIQKGSPIANLINNDNFFFFPNMIRQNVKTIIKTRMLSTHARRIFPGVCSTEDWTSFILSAVLSILRVLYGPDVHDLDWRVARGINLD